MSYLTETLLEMHFHAPLREAFEEVFGARVFRILKPSTRREVWIGFDQAWVRTTMREQDLFRELRQGIVTGSVPVGAFYVGYFLQFKVVEELNRSSRLLPQGFFPPYFRIELSLEPNARTGMSQHETLVRLSSIRRAAVYYACPMVFDSDGLYDSADLDRLRCVDVRSAPSGWSTNDRHFIAFRNDKDPTPVWCSAPTPATSWSFNEWIRSSELRPHPMTAPEMAAFITDGLGIIGTTMAPSEHAALPPSFTLLSFEGAPSGQVPR